MSLKNWISGRNKKIAGKHKPKSSTADDDQKKFQDILLLTNDWIWEIDPEGRYVFTSGQIKEILGYAPEEIIGMKVFDIFDPAEKEKTTHELKKIFASQKPIINRINWNVSKSGKKVCLVTNGIPVYDVNGEFKGYRGVDKDITARKKAEKDLIREIENHKQARQELMESKKETDKASHSKSFFLAKMSHEIRTPLNGIIGTSMLLKESSLSPEQLDFMDIIETSANNLHDIVNNILDISKIEAGKIEPENNRFNLIEILNEVERLLSFNSREKKLEFTVEIAPGIPKFLVGDAFRLKQVLINLAGNAVKFTSEGSIKIIAEIASETDKAIELLISVIDTGIGIPREKQQHLFREYSQADPSISRKYGGSGLGLLISKMLTEMMGGKIGVESEVDKGSRFWFRIPFEKAETPEPARLEKPPEEDTPGSKENKLKILLVEDNLINQKVAMMNLKLKGHQVEIAVNGKMAIEFFKHNQYDLILMDIQMPVMDGITATKEIRKLEKEQKNSNKVKIIAITANAMKEDREKCLSSGMDGYITKPFRYEDLEAYLNLPGWSGFNI